MFVVGWKIGFLNCSENGKCLSLSILGVGVERALSQAGIDHDMCYWHGGDNGSRKRVSSNGIVAK
jgi:hypothetical protein